MPTPSPRAMTVVGVAGSALLALSSWWTAATPYSFRVDPPAVIDVLPQGTPVAAVAWYVGLTTVVLAWLGLGRWLWHGGADEGGHEGVRVMRTAGLATAAPMLLAMPAMSRDLWAYAAQARIAAAGLDPYVVSPLRSGDASLANVSARWVDTVAPYGPLWTLLGRALEAVTGTHEVAGVLVLRLPAALGFVLLAWTVPALARRVGAPATTATWLAVANPMVVLHGVGGGHNDVLMVGLLAAGLLAAVSGGRRVPVLLAAGALVGAAAAIKVPAVVAAPFLPLLWARYRPGAPAWTSPPWREAVRTRLPDTLVGLVPVAVGVLVVLVGSTVAEGHGLAWLTTANTADHGGGPVGTAALLLVLVVVWALALRNAQWPLLAAALLAPALLSTFSLAWYWFWPLVPAVMVIRGRLAPFLVAVGSISTVYYIRSTGVNFALRPEFILVISAVGAWLVLDRRWRPFAEAAAARREASRSSGS